MAPTMAPARAAVEMPVPLDWALVDLPSIADGVATEDGLLEAGSSKSEDVTLKQGIVVVKASASTSV